MKIIGISGTNGSGKDTVGVMLQKRHDYLFFSGTDLLRQEAAARGLKGTRKDQRSIANEWRAELGEGAIIQKAVEAFKNSAGEHKGLAVASLRMPGEADEVHKLGGKVVWVDAKPETRYKRVTSGDRGRKADDNKTYEEFLSEEAEEMNNPAPGGLNMLGVKAKADIFLRNEGNDIEAFKSETSRELANIV